MVGERATQEGRLSGRCYPEQVRVSLEAESQEQLQSQLSDAEEKEWHLVGVAGGFPRVA